MKNPLSSLVEFTGSKKLGTILLKMGAISETDLEQALKIKNDNPEKLLGEIIVEKGFSTKYQVNYALDEQRKENRLGVLLISSGIIRQEQLDDALSTQKMTGNKLGNILIEKSYCNEIQINNALKFQKRDNRLGTLLVRHNFISETELQNAIDIQLKSGKLLGETLINLGYISSQQLTDVLLIQSRAI